MKRIRGLVVVLAAMAMVAFSACGDDDDETASPEEQEDAPSVSAEPIKIMSLGSFKTQVGDFTQNPAGAQAAAEAINAEGGIDGRQIEVIVCDDGMDPNKALDCARSAVDEEMVAVVGAFSLGGSDFMAILAEAGIPVVGNFLINPAELSSPVSYPILGGSPLSFKGGGAYAAEEGWEKMSVFTGELLEYNTELFERSNEAHGGSTELHVVSIPSNVSDVSPYVADLLSNSPDGVQLLQTGADAIRLIAAIRDQGSDVPILTNTVVTGPQGLAALADNAEGLRALGGALPPSSDDPAVEQWKEEMAAFDPEAELDDFSSDSWASVHIIAEVGKGVDNLDAASLKDALDSAEGIEVGLYPPLQFKEPVEHGQRIFNQTVLFLEVKDGVLVASTGEFVDPLNDN